VGGCAALPQTITIKVNPTPNMTNVDTKTICSGQVLNIPLKSDVTSSYIWSAQDNTYTTGEDTETQTTHTITNTIDNSTLLSQTVVYTISPTSTVGLCPGNVQTVSVTVNPNPTMTSKTTDLVCGKGFASSIVLTADIPSTFTWKTTNNANTTGESTTTQTTDTINDAIVNKTTDIQTLTYTVTPTSTGGSCVGASQLVVQSIAQPKAIFSHNIDNGTPPLLVSFTNSSENANTYEWIYGDGRRDTTVDANHTFYTPDVYTVKLIATNNHLCPDTDSTTIIVYKLIVSNVFTPNGDGNNDFFAINTTGIASLDLEIYNRWGIKLFETHTPDGKWDGHTTSGKTSEEGTYFYMLKATGIDGQTYTEKGYLTLLR
jgi:gliding motility-associated-like protein